ncbi:MAG TPA: hypothetical protein VG247_21215 [Pseudonocardiaceae bacterium]|jgi:hypothetical protein|nr:hypothetical protein [Pseudonocardiaceae bacterium]
MSQWVMAGADDNDPTFSPGNELWGIPALRSRDVWINLDLLFPRDPAVSPTRAISGVDMTGVIPGVLHDWILSGTGVWYGVCQFRLFYLDGRDLVVELRDQLIPQSALRQRES